MKIKTEENKRKAIWAELSQFDVLTKEHSFIEITEWTNQEGADITISAYSEKFISLTWGEIEAIKKLSKIFLKE